MKAIRKAHEVECIQYNGNPEEVRIMYADFIDRDVITNVTSSFMMLRSNYYDPVTLDNGDWLVLSGDYENMARVFSDISFKRKFDELN